MLTHHWLKTYLVFFRVITVYAQPMHIARTAYLFFAYYRHVVLGVAGYYTSPATYAGIKVDREFKMMSFFFNRG